LNTGFLDPESSAFPLGYSPQQTISMSKIWGDGSELNARGQLHKLPPKPLGHRHVFRRTLRRPDFVDSTGHTSARTDAATLTITTRENNGAESASPTRLCSLEDCHLKRSVNPAE
jgi:hypothetical protein